MGIRQSGHNYKFNARFLPYPLELTIHLDCFGVSSLSPDLWLVRQIAQTMIPANFVAANLPIPTMDGDCQSLQNQSWMFAPIHYRHSVDVLNLDSTVEPSKTRRNISPQWAGKCHQNLPLLFASVRASLHHRQLLSLLLPSNLNRIRFRNCRPQLVPAEHLASL